MRHFRILTLLTMALLASQLYATVQITQLVPSVSSPQPVGTSVTWTVTATDTNPGPLTYQFSEGYKGQTLKIVRDFALTNSFQWTPSITEGFTLLKLRRATWRLVRLRHPRRITQSSRGWSGDKQLSRPCRIRW